VNDGPLDVAAGVFTSNRFKAAPVLWTQQAVSDGQLRAVVLNSGGANACTGPGGFADTHHTAEGVAEKLRSAGVDIGPGDVGVCSTGLIGERLPIGKLLAGVDAAKEALSDKGGDAAAIAIMTTDTVRKTASVFIDGFTLGGMAKGAGMLAPALATMLVVITTDAVVDAAQADSALREACSLSFDRIDSDGCMSTNDTVLLLASGASGITPDPAVFVDAVTQVCSHLARQLIADAEGASKDIEIEVHGAATVEDALEVARAIARSNLLKCAIHGEDPNWGRVLSAVGTTAAAFEPDLVDVAINGVWVCLVGAIGESRDGVDLSNRHVGITVNLHAGSERVTVWTNDLTAEYVHENSAYAT
jgi:glutamate N-acetyltransferase/amino-acid N-acetyltransferase